jgi:hypothetical protein
MDAASDGATGPDAASRDATVHPRDAGRDAMLDVEPGSDATSADASTPAEASTCDDGFMDVLSTSDTQVDAEDDLTVVSDAGTPDSGTQDSGTSVEAGAPDAPVDTGTADTALSDVNAPADAAEASAEASVCNLGVVVATPIPPLSGTVNVSGTEGVPGGTVLAGDCQEFVAGTTSGTLTFSITSVGCYISYLDASGKTYTSTINAPSTFDGDKYTCIYNYGAPAGPQTYAACPELDGLQNTLSAAVSLSVTRSTGAVSFSRLCGTGGGCTFGFGPGSPSTQFTLSGSLSCADAGGEDGGGLVIVCGASTCPTATQFCCGLLESDGGIGCLDNADNSGPVCLSFYYCSGPESCPPDNVCCTTPGTRGSTCQDGTTCPSDGMTLCEADGDCPLGETCNGSDLGTCGE